jgi:acetyl esterase/lipase
VRVLVSFREAARAWALLLTLAVASACGDSPSEPDNDHGVDLDALFAAPTSTETSAVLADWQARDVSVQGFREEQTASVVIGLGVAATLRVVSHTVGGARHFGAIIVPDGAAAGSLPVLVYAHGGDNGVAVEEVLFLSLPLGEVAAHFVYVIPSFRSETLRFGGSSWRSEGDASPWDRDVDDALALLSAALANTDAADPSRIAVLGFSRGGGVGLLMSVRDPRIDAVVDFFGPTDFFGAHVRAIVDEALRGRLRDLPGLVVLNTRYIQPLRTGAVSLAEMRWQLLLRSPVYFADRLQGVQVHHGTADDVVDVSHAQTLISRLEALGRGAPAFEFYLYPGGDHNPLSLQGAAQRTAAYLSRLPTDYAETKSFTVGAAPRATPRAPPPRARR